MPLYGRSFEMSEAGCFAEMCKFSGPASGAAPGVCTGTRGYISNWEIERILADDSVDKQEHESEEAGDILVYESNQWVSWMKPDTYQARVSMARELNMRGTSDWAIDLNVSAAGEQSNGNGSGIVFISPDIYTEPNPTIYCLPPCTFVMPPLQLSSQTLLTQEQVTRTMQEVWRLETTRPSGVTKTILVSTTSTLTITIPSTLTTEIELWNINWTDTDQRTFSLSSSIVFPPVTTTQPPFTTTIDGITYSTTGVRYTYSAGPFPRQTTTPIPPPPPFPATIVVSSGYPRPTCKAGQKCGSLCESNCFPDPGCFGICDCIGLGCPDCTLLPCANCIGPGCVTGGGGGGGGGNDGDPTTCSEKTTVTDCSVACSVTPKDSTLSTSCYTTTCSAVTVCQSTGSTTTSRTTVGCAPLPSYPPWFGSNPNVAPVTLGQGVEGGFIVGPMEPPPSPITSFIDCSHQNQSPGLGLLSGYCVCDGSTFSESVATQVTPWNSCGYTTKPSRTVSVSTQMYISTRTDECEVCTLIGHNQACTSLDDCVPKPTEPPLPQPRCVTAHVYLNNCIFGGDTMTIRVWEQGVETCAEDKNLQGASDVTEWDFDCGNGASAHVTGNGRTLSYRAGDGWEAEIPQTDGHDNTYTCGNFGLNGEIKGSNYEYVFANDYCGGCQTAELCDYRSYCPDFEGTCE